MSHINSIGVSLQTIPHQRYSTTTVGTSSTLNATGETTQVVGAIQLENPLGGSKTISAAGGGKIVWMTGAVTFANAGTTFVISIQDLSTASSPGQGDGGNDVLVSYTGGGGGVTGSAVQQSTMTSGSKTIAHGDLVALVFSMTARGGADSIVVQHAPNGTEVNPNILGGSIIENTSGSYANTSAYPMAYIVFDDGSVGWMYGFSMQAAVNTVTINSGTGTADEYGNLINLPFTFYALGIEAMVSLAGNSSDLELLLYSNPLGAPAVQRILSVDATQVSATSSVRFIGLPFSSPYLIRANTPVCVSCRPTTANNVSLYAWDGDGVKSDRIHPPNTYAYAVRRLDNAGAFSDYNGGTAKTRMMSVHLYGYYVEQGVNNASFHLGI